MDSNECLLIIDNIRNNNQIDDLINNKITKIKAKILISSNVEANIDNFTNYKLNPLKDYEYIEIFYNNYKKNIIKPKLKEIIDITNDNIYFIILLARYAKEYKIAIPKFLTMLNDDPILLILKCLNKSDISTLASLYIIEKSINWEMVGKSNLISKNNELINKYNSNIIENVDKLVNLGLVYVEDNIYFIPTPLKDRIKTEPNLLFSEYKNSEYKNLIIAIFNELETLDKDFFNNNLIEENIGCRLEYINIANNLLELFGNKNSNEYSLEIFNLIKILAKIYEDLNYDYEALHYYNRAVKIGEKIFGKNTIDISKIYDSLAYIYKKIKNYKKSIEWTIKSVNISLKNIGEKNIESANKYSNLGECYISLNNYNKALYYMNKALRIRKTLLGENSVDTIKTYNNIGIIYQELNDYSKALKYYKKTLNIKEVLSEGENKTYVEKAITYNNIGVAYKYKKDYNRSLDFFKKAIKIKEKMKEESSLESATIYYNIGVLYYSKREINEALEMLIKAATSYKKILGNSEITASTYNDIANIYNKDKKSYKNALMLYLKTAFIYLEIEKSDKLKELYENITKIDSIIAVNQEKNIQKIVKKNDKTAIFINKIFDQYMDIPNKDHKNMAYIYDNLATIYYNKCEFSISLEYYKKSLAIFEKLANKHYEEATTDGNSNIEYLKKIAIINNSIGVVYNSLGYYYKAMEYFEKALTYSDGEILFLRSQIYNNTGISLMYIKKYDMAMEFFNKALSINREDEISNTVRLENAEIYNNIGGCYRLMSNPNKAIQFLHKAIQIRNELVKEDDISNAKFINNLAVANTYLGKYKEAEKMLIKAIEIYEKIETTHPSLVSLSCNLLNLYHKYIKSTNNNLNNYYKLVFEGIFRKYF